MSIWKQHFHCWVNYSLKHSCCHNKLLKLFAVKNVPRAPSTGAFLAKWVDLSSVCMLVYGHNKLSWCCFYRHTHAHTHRHKLNLSRFHTCIIRVLTVITLVCVGRIRYNELEIMGFVCCFTGKCSPCQGIYNESQCYQITITVSLQHYLRCIKEQHS